MSFRAESSHAQRAAALTDRPVSHVPLKKAAFTLSEVLTTLTLLTLLVFIVLPVLSRAHALRTTAVCFSNNRALIRAWELYAQDHQGLLVGNYTGGDINIQPPPGRALWAAGWLDWGNSRDNTNLAFIRTERYAKLTPYFAADERNIHKCALDRFLSRQQLSVGFKERVRSVAMNATVGEGNVTTTGPFDITIYAQARRQNELIHPGPGQTSVFLEEHPDSINDPMLFPPRQTSWIDIPSGLHDNGAVVSFADGHAQLQTWRRSLRNMRVRYNFFPPTARSRDPDISWMSFHSNRRSDRSY